MKNCPFCAEEIQEAAIKCKHCGSMLIPGSAGTPPPLPAPAGKVTPWHFRPGTMVLAFLFVGPFMLPMLWFNPHLDARRKLAWTAVIIVVTALLTWMMWWSIQRLIEHWGQIREVLSW